MNYLLKKIAPEDINNAGLKELAKRTSVGFVKELMLKAPGIHIYVPTKSHNLYIDTYIRENFGVQDVRGMAKSLGISTRTVYRYLNKVKKKTPD